MKKSFFLSLVLILITTISYSKAQVKIYTEKTTTGYAIYADNKEFCEMPMEVQKADYVAQLGIDGLGKKAHVIPGFKNTFMIRMAKMMSIATSISSGGKMMDKVMN